MIAPAWTARRIFWTLLGVGAVLRIAAAIPLAFHHADELWQYTEPAYHIAIGPWVIAWEMRDGIRTWLIPAFLAPWTLIGHAIGAHILLPKLALIALSIVIIGSATALGMRLSRLHGFFAGFAAAIWYELVYFGPRALSEPVGLALLMGAVWLLLTGTRSDRRVLAAGLLLGLAFAARLQYAPAIATLALWEGRTRWRSVWLPLLIGGVAGLAIDGAIDALMGQVPLRWMVENFRINLAEHRSDKYGVFPPGWYFTNQLWTWNIAAAPILGLAILGARRYPVLLAIALVHLAAHSLIPHKEYRFVLPTIALLVILAGIGTADLLRRLPCAWLLLGIRTAAAIWLLASIALSVVPAYWPNWGATGAFARSIREAGRVPGVCGFALYKPFHLLNASYALYDRPGAIYAFHGASARADAAAQAPAYNVVLTQTPVRNELPPAYRMLRCDDFTCLYTRPGTCDGSAAGAFEINRVVASTGE